MPSRADSVPLEEEILCESCGYSLTGLVRPGGDEQGRCPECGAPIAYSTIRDGRGPTPWETPGLRGRVRLWQTWWGVVRSPTRFFRGMLARSDPKLSAPFAFVQHFLAAYGFAIGVSFHAMFVEGRNYDLPTAVFLSLLGAALLTPLILAVIHLTHRLTAYLSALEARYHGLRLPHRTVIRALHYHSAQLPLVAGAVAVYTSGYRLMLAWDLLPRGPTEMTYVYGLCGLVVLSAGYLFWTYWLAMKSLMYANR